MKKTKKEEPKKKASPAAKPAMDGNVVYVVSRARYGNVDLSVWCDVFKTLKAAKAAVRARYDLYAKNWDEDEAEEDTSSLVISDDGMEFSTVNVPNCSAESCSIKEVRLDEVKDN